MTENRCFANFIFKREDYCPKSLIISKKKKKFFYLFFYNFSAKTPSRLFFLHKPLMLNT